MSESGGTTENQVPGMSTAGRPKRSRTGCLTCRTRRRKCDETKPICQNCISKDLKCQYAAAFQILGKNNFTPQLSGHNQYTNVQFVSTDENRDLGQNRTDARYRGDDQAKSPAESGLDMLLPGQCHPDKIARPTSSSDLAGVKVTDFASHSPSPNSYEFALRGLLELGSGSGPNSTAKTSSETQGQISHSESTDIAAGFSAEVLNDETNANRVQENSHIPTTKSVETTQDTFDVAEWNDHTSSFLAPEGVLLSTTSEVASRISPASKRIPTQGDHPPDEIELLTYYRYHIAPWLDMCDNEQPFGVELMMKAPTDSPLRKAILKVTEDALLYSSICYIRSPNQEDQSETPVLLQLLSLFMEAKQDLARFWLDEHAVRKIHRISEALLEELAENSNLTAAAFWLSIRLVLSCALVSTFPIRIALPTGMYDSQGLPVDPTSIASVRMILALCVHAVMFSQGDDDRWLQRLYDSNRADTWHALVERFAQWYMSRSADLQPIVELYTKDGLQVDNNFHDFPTIVFTNAGALLANQLYHTGMLLLLQSKPRFVGKATSNSSSMSILWHAHRICGIAIQNDGRFTWDPCLIASLLVAARTVTHRSQQDTIIQTLKTAQTMTGNIDAFVKDIQMEWYLAEQ